MGIRSPRRFAAPPLVEKGAAHRRGRGGKVDKRNAEDGVPYGSRGVRQKTGIGGTDSHASVRTEIGIGIWTKNELFK